MDFAGLLLTLMALSAIFKEPTKTPEKLTSFDPEDEYTDPQYESPEELTTFYPADDYADQQSESDIGFSPVPSPSPSEDNVKLPAETEVIPSDYDNINVTEEHIELDPTGTVPNEMDILHQDYVDYTATTEQLELDATPTVQVEINTTITNDTSITQTEDILKSTAITLIKFGTIMLIIASGALFITTALIMWNNDSIFFSLINYKFLNIKNSEISENTEVVKVINQDTFTI